MFIRTPPADIYFTLHCIVYDRLYVRCGETLDTDTPTACTAIAHGPIGEELRLSLSARSTSCVLYAHVTQQLTADAFTEVIQPTKSSPAVAYAS